MLTVYKYITWVKLLQCYK